MCKSIWRIVSESGLRCIVLNEPVTFPPERVNGVMTTGLMTPHRSSEWIYPRELRHEINTVAGGYECDIPPDFRSLLSRDRPAALEMLEKMAFKIFRVSRYLASNYAWDLLAVIFTTTDRLQHYWWRNPQEIAEHYRIIDRMIGEYLEYSKEHNADLIVVSDHGFGPCDEFFLINEWLEELGLAVYKDSLLSKILSPLGFTKSTFRNAFGSWPEAFRMLPPLLQELVRRHVPENAEDKKIDLAESSAYARSSAGVFVQDGNRREFIAQALRTLRSRTDGRPIFEKIARREDELHGAYSYRGADLLLQPSLGHYVAISKQDRRGLTGTHRPEGIFIHYRSNSQFQHQGSRTVRPWDVGATILTLLGLPIPEYFDGRALVNEWED
jgi:predicted AlkP superfamily phosphohydrolase/phosphomutase